MSAARNKGLDAANGRYVAFVDADDKLEPDFMKELHSYAEQSGADITQCSFFNVDEKGVKTPDEGAVDSVYSTSDEILHAHFKGQQGDAGRQSLYLVLRPRFISILSVRALSLILRFPAYGLIILRCMKGRNLSAGMTAPS